MNPSTEATVAPAGAPAPRAMAPAEKDVAANKLRSFVERIERLEAEKRAIDDDIKEIYSEAKGNGFEPKILRRVVALRKLSADERQEQDALLEIYRDALGV